jgi:hypothetical protein
LPYQANAPALAVSTTINATAVTTNNDFITEPPILSSVNRYRIGVEISRRAFSFCSNFFLNFATAATVEGQSIVDRATAAGFPCAIDKETGRSP